MLASSAHRGCATRLARTESQYLWGYCSSRRQPKCNRQSQLRPRWGVVKWKSASHKDSLMFKSEGKVRELFRKYGKTALATHLTVYGVTFAGLYFAIENKLGPQSLLIRYGLLSDQQVKDDANPKERGWFSNLLTGPSSSIALAFLCNKALLPVRAPVTIGLTPMVARALHQRAATAATASASKHSSTPMSSTMATSQAKSANVKDKTTT